ncbi:MAG: hypothetical protein ACM34A_14305 [Bacillota bacterium]
MRPSHLNIKPLAAALLMAGMLSACGGGSDGKSTTSGTSTDTAGGSQQSGNTNGTSSGSNADPSSGTPSGSTNTGGASSTQATVMTCDDGATYQCSGAQVVAAGEVALTDFGVQAYGRSTSDQKADRDPTTATGFELASGGTTEVRLGRSSDGSVSRVAVLLDRIGISWDGVKDRPRIIEGFDPTQGVVTSTSGKLKFDNPLPPSSNLSYYDFATAGRNGTQANYAYNRYFPRSTPDRCPTGSSAWCGSKETDGPQVAPGDWRGGGSRPDAINALRFHEDGDIHAGDATNGSWLDGGSGFGVPFPGSKGFRTYTGLSYQYANLGAWFTQDTVQIAEWTGQAGTLEHSTNRRGIVAFGALTNPAVIPATGSATYSGRVYGRYASSKDAEPTGFEGTATVTVDFAKHQASITIQPDSGTIPAGFTATTTFGTGSGNARNAMSGSVDNGKLTGTVTGRYFGPVVSTGSTAQGPAEAGGAFALKNVAGEAVLGGFIVRKQ